MEWKEEINKYKGRVCCEGLYCEIKPKTEIIIDRDNGLMMVLLEKLWNNRAGESK